jgi:cytochrome c553
MGIHKHSKIAAAFVLAAFASGAALSGLSGQDRVVPIPVNRPPGVVRGKDVDQLMQSKLEHAQKILRGLVVHDLEAVKESAEALKLMGLDPPRDWKHKPGDDEVYDHFRTEFMRLAARLEQEAAADRMAGAAWFQQQLTAACVTCHDYIRDEGHKAGGNAR